MSKSRKQETLSAKQVANRALAQVLRAHGFKDVKAVWQGVRSYRAQGMSEAQVAYAVLDDFDEDLRLAAEREERCAHCGGTRAKCSAESAGRGGDFGPRLQAKVAEPVAEYVATPKAAKQPKPKHVPGALVGSQDVALHRADGTKLWATLAWTEPRASRAGGTTRDLFVHELGASTGEWHTLSESAYARLQAGKDITVALGGLPYRAAQE